MNYTNPFTIFNPNEHWAPTQLHIKQEKWDKVKNDLKSFNDICKIFDVQ